MSTSIAFNADNLQHDNYTTVASASIQTKTPTNKPTSIFIQNTHASNSASVSFDGGSNFITIKAGQSLSIDLGGKVIKSYKVQDTVDNSHATLECLYASEA